ncbi:polysaccharide deacetylase family protein [Plantactinospora siamensis]|uniref:Polysaccharide deacetylase family protein n=1 Tax=Plantactinospora siamensis TaxID=555372 RepID=A0ABV6NZ11_9ACTN
MRSFRRGRAAIAAAALLVTGATVLTVATAPSMAAGCTGYVGLTFDDGPTAGNTTTLLNTLKANGVRATLFNIGQNAQNNPSLVQAEKAAGMWIGNHSWTHPHLTQLSQSQINSEVSQTQQVLQQLTGQAPKLFRPPYGETNSTLKSVEASYGLTEIIWDVDSQDWNNASVDQIVQAASRLQAGQIILMHDWPANTIAAIPRIVSGLSSRGLCAGMISPTTGRAVAPDGGTPTNPPTSGPPTNPPTSAPPTNPPTSAPPTNPPTSAPPTNPSGGCTATYHVINSWTGGFQAQVDVTSSTTITGWTVRLTLAAGQTISSLWGGVNTGTSGQVSVRNASYNGTVGPGGSTNFGFVANGNSSPAPSGLTCTPA